MELKEFIKNVLTEVNAAVDEARQETSREIRFSENENKRTIEFDIAVSAEATKKNSGKAGVKVLSFVEGGGEVSNESRNATVSRVTFGLHIEPRTKEENAKIDADYKAAQERRRLRPRQRGF